MNSEVTITVEDVALRRTSWIDVTEALADKARLEVLKRFGRECDLAIMEVQREELSRDGSGAIFDFVYQAAFEVLPPRNEG